MVASTYNWSEEYTPKANWISATAGKVSCKLRIRYLTMMRAARKRI